MGGVSFLFGTVTGAHDTNSINNLRQHLEKHQGLEWVRDTVSELPAYWEALVQKVPSIDGSFPGEETLHQLDRWLREGINIDEEPLTLSNTILLPLVVILGLIEFWQYVESKNPECEDPLREFLEQLRTDSTSDVESLGLCAGLLTAYAVASSHTRADFEKSGAAAIRLAMMVGVATDAQDAWYGQAKSYAAAWRTAEQGEQMKRAIDLVYPQAYVSVLYDSKRVTITTTAQWIRSTILRQLQGAGLAVAESNVQGRIHSPNSESKDIADALCEICEATPSLQFADVSQLALRTYTNDGHGKPVQGESLHEAALRSSLAKQCNWYGTFAALPLSAPDSNQEIVSFGPDRCVPPSLIASLGARFTHVSNIVNASTAPSSYPITNVKPRGVQEKMTNGYTTPLSASGQGTAPREVPYMENQKSSGASSRHQENSNSSATSPPEHTIAVVGMSIKTAGADDVEEFSQMIQSGVSQHQEITPDRLKFHTLFREGDWDPSYKWYANWMRDIDKFDHQFFKRSPREAANMDPQQRLTLQAAYQAVEKAGYFLDDEKGAEKECDIRNSARHVGVYVGVTVDDYQNHVRTQRANAFSITGTMRSLIAGKIAHHFGWTGPAMTVDTACSSSAVAIHNACRDLLAGDCNAALAGGANVITDPLAFQDLAAAGFLSPTGQCKPFDERADGYCRGEAVGFVFLKRLSDALKDGNQILGCIASSAVYQNENHTPIFVPNSPSLSGLFRDVIKKGQVQPSEISVVECHGTGTPVGDPAEWEGVRQALEGLPRTEPIYIGSAKGHVGHTEAASGVVALIKVLSMVQGGYIPPQASHSKLSHLIQATDMMQVSTTRQSWQPARKVALLNNYGASGSNVAMIITESPFPRPPIVQIQENETTDLPFCIAGKSVNSVKANCARILNYLNRDSEVRIADLAFNMHRQFNRSLPHRLSFKCGSIEDMKSKLYQLVTSPSVQGAHSQIITVRPNRRVILCFGGQVSTSIGLDRHLYDRTWTLRLHLDKCDAEIQSIGLQSIYPGIFSQEAVQDQQHLQTMLFAMQYSCAMCWMQSGLSGRVVAVMGHSFGELTAMCVSGVLSLHDAVKLVAGRARLVRDLWGSDTGVMLALEADGKTVQRLLSEANERYNGLHPVNIACYNGPRSFTIAGSQAAIDIVTDLLSQKFSSVRSKTLRVTNAFHSSLVEPLEEELELLGEHIKFRKSRIPLERTTENRFPLDDLGPRYPVEQMRQPVFFHHAVQRLAKEHPDCVWLEAGTNSTVTVMAQRALETSPTSSHYLQSVNLSDAKAFNKLSDVVVSLWKEGLSSEFWPHNACQTYDYATLVLPPYQFERDRHWVELRSPVEFVEQIKQSVRAENIVVQPNLSLVQDCNQKWFFTQYKDIEKKQPCFRINTESTDYQDLVNSHVIANTTGICSGMLQVNLAIGALFSLHPDWTSNGLRASLHGMVNHTPVCLSSSRDLCVEFEDRGSGFWDFKIVSSSEGSSRMTHTTARLELRDPKDVVYLSQFRQLARLIDHKRCLALLNVGPSHEGVEILQGRNVYRAFHDVVDFGDQYRSLRWLVGHGNESAGRFSKTEGNSKWFDQLRGEHISQIGGVWVNCMTDHRASDIFLGAEIEMWMVSPDWANRSLPDHCDVFARHQRNEETGDYTSDSFVFDSASGDLVEVLLGVQFIRTPVAPFTRLLQRMISGQPTGDAGFGSRETTKPASLPTDAPTPAALPNPSATAQPRTQESRKEAPKPQEIEPSSRDLHREMAEVVANLVGMDVADIEPDSNLVDFGVDSLLGMELRADIEKAFDCTPDEMDILGATTLRELVRCLPIAVDVPGVFQYSPPDKTSSDHSSQGSGPSWSTPPSEKSASSTEAASLLWGPKEVLESFVNTKRLGDQMIKDFGIDNFDSVIIPESNRLCVALVVECFEELGCPLRTAQPGQKLDPIPFQPQHKILMKYIYNFLENTVHLLTVEPGGQLTRTNNHIPATSSQDILNELISKYPQQDDFLRLTHHAGIHLARALSGATDGNRVLMSHPEGRRLCQSVYHNYVINRLGFETMRLMLENLSKQMRTVKGPLKVLELGAGTGSATTALLPLLASLDIPVEYTFTDLSSSLVAQARRTLGKTYPFMKFAVQDIEKPVGSDLAGQQHIVIASHCVHATRSLTESTRNIRHALRPEGFLMMFEMREAWPALDIPFGLYEGWWLFEDGRTHAYTGPEVWKRCLTEAGYGGVEWTEGQLPEHKYYMVLLALASEV
jgi:acyl transferase domain-containing protein/acyl carrier protein/SAM-dependent methyltransferase